MINKRNLLFILTIVFFYSNLPIYLEIEKISIINIKLYYYVILFFVITLILTISRKSNILYLKNPLNAWMIFYVVLLLFWFILPSNLLTSKEFFIRIYNLIFMFMMTIFIFMDEKDFKNIKKGIFISTIFAILLNIFEFINPEFFYSSSNPYSVIGRSAGLYLNPTISGMAILLGMILTITFIPKKYRTLFMLFSLIGILLTFSRGPLIGWIIAFIYIMANTTIYKKDKFIAAIVFILFAAIGIPFLIDFIQNNYNEEGQNLINRINWFNDTQSGASQSERLRVILLSFNLFAENPFFGSGLGSTLHWEERASTHNMYLFLGAEFGILGILLYPLSIIAATWGGIKKEKTTIVLFIIISLIIGLFRHNQFDQFFSIISFALAANISFNKIRTRNV